MEMGTLLRGEEALQDDRLLETDMMRFLAIIGIVFWIIFALIKSIPFQTPEAGFPIKQPDVGSKPVPVSPQVGVEPEVTSHSHPVSAQMGRKPDSNLSEAVINKTKQAKNLKAVTQGQQGVQMQFQSLKDLLDLMTVGKVRLFCRARATGFDLFFEGTPQGNTMTFKTVQSLPSKLWEIKTGKDCAYFVDLVSDTSPAIRLFPSKEVLVAFADQGLEKRVEDTLGQLTQSGHSGVLSITRNSDTVFSSYDAPATKND